MGFTRKNPMAGIELDKPKIKGLPVADAGDIAAFQQRWPVGTRERLIFGLALYTGAARIDLTKLGRKNLKDELLVYRRQKSGVTARSDRPNPRYRACVHPDCSRKALESRKSW